MEGLFENSNQQNALFQDEKKKDGKKVFKTFIVILLIIILLMGSAYGVFYYLTEIKSKDAKTNIVELAKSIDFNKYTDIQGLTEYFDNINSKSYEFNVDVEANSHKLNNAVKDMLKNEDINIKEFKLNFNGKVDRTNNKLQTLVDLKHKDNSIIDFQIQDNGEKILLFGKDFFQEHIGIEKDKFKSFMIKEFDLDNDISSTLDDFTKLSLEKNYISEANAILSSILKSLPGALDTLTSENFEINRNVKVNYRNNSLNAETYTVKLDYKEYANFIERLKNLSKLEANNASIEVQSLIGKTDSMVNSIINYFVYTINLRPNQNFNLNVYSVKNNIIKIDLMKTEEGKEDILAFEVELISEKNSNEILVSNEELKLKITITKDNSKIYTKIDIDGKIPIPSLLDLENNPVKEIEDDIVDEEKEKEKEEVIEETQDGSIRQIHGETNLFSTEAILAEPITDAEDSYSGSIVDPNTPVSNDNLEQEQNSTNNQTQQNVDANVPLTNVDGTQDIYFHEDQELLEIEESIYTKKMDLKANLSFDRPLNNSSAMNFNLVFNSNEIELFIKADISMKDKVEIETPLKIITLTSMEADRLKSNMKAINEKVYTTFIQKLKKMNLMK